MTQDELGEETGMTGGAIKNCAITLTFKINGSFSTEPILLL